MKEEVVKSRVLLNYLHCVSEFVAIFLPVFNLHLLSNCRPSEWYELRLEPDPYVHHLGSITVVSYPER